jgi:hypothetical protein
MKGESIEADYSGITEHLTIICKQEAIKLLE